ncbi:hypothetical protein VNO77_34518 [Canavalia gladiata]|uniref:Uncharacterized protein n=1 Tax=Canavalia gladiata TaxID=3824 RepID=A0AAN9PYL3_CANGL
MVAMHEANVPTAKLILTLPSLVATSTETVVAFGTYTQHPSKFVQEETIGCDKLALHFGIILNGTHSSEGRNNSLGFLLLNGKLEPVTWKVALLLDEISFKTLLLLLEIAYTRSF